MIIPAVIISVLLAVLIAGYIAFRIFLIRRPGKLFKMKKKLFDAPPPSFTMDREWLNSLPLNEAVIRSADSLSLYARMIPGEMRGVYVISCHGYRANLSASAGFAHMFHDLGFSVLMPDARAHGKSEGRYIGMGWPERRDVCKWIRYILEKEPDAKIILHGVSMGGATVMNTVGEKLPPNVVCAIEDCGFISPREIFEYQISRLKLPRFILFAAAPFAKILARFSALDRNMTRNALRRCRIPMLMIHGSGDRFVPVSHIHEAAAAYGDRVETLIVQGAPHAESILADGPLYRKTVSNFINRFI